MQQVVAPAFKNCSDCPIRHRAVCAKCDSQELELLEDIKYYRSFTAGQPVMWAGDHMDFVASVVSGVATLTQTMEDGRTQMVGLLLPSDFVGRPGRGVAAYTVTATTDLTMCCFRRKPFEKMIDTTPHVAHRLLEMTLDELDAARDWMLLLGRKTAREKIASLLMLIAKRTMHPDGKVMGDTTRIELPISRETMANFLGLTIETVSRQFTGLRKDGVIDLDGNRVVRIPDLEGLLFESGDDGDGGTLF